MSPRADRFADVGFRALPGEMVCDLFAGGGGASEGIEKAINRPVDIAVNHSRAAIAMHMVNHPETRHFCEDVFDVSPLHVTCGRIVGLLWLSPDCTHFSRARGGKPADKKVRSLAWVAVRWAREVKPRMIVLENVEEFQTWGPLDDEGYPIVEQKGETFRAWCAALVDLGYTLDFKTMVAADYGAPTTRKRLFLIARRDRSAIAWPEPTHGIGRAHAWRPASEIIDWSLPCPSIFERKRPLAEATLRRIAVGMQRYVIGSAKPFIIPVKTWGGGGNGPRSIDEPMRTITTSKRGEYALVTPYVVNNMTNNVPRSVEAPLSTILTGGHKILIAPTLVHSGNGERPGQFPRTYDIRAPLGTVVAGGQKHRLVAAFLTKNYGSPPHRMRAVGSSLHAPVATITTQDHHSLTAAFLAKRGSAERSEEVRLLLQRFLKGDIDPQVELEGEQYVVADVGTRMLQPHELFAAQGFPDDYVIAPDFDGKPMTKEMQIDLCGNSVPPQEPEAIVRTQLAA